MSEREEGEEGERERGTEGERGDVEDKHTVTCCDGRMTGIGGELTLLAGWTVTLM